MTSDVKPKRRFLGVQHFHRSPALKRCRELVGKIHFFRHRAEETGAGPDPITLCTLRPRERSINRTMQASAPRMYGPSVIQRIEGPRAYQTLHDAFVQGSRVHSLGKIEERAKWTGSAGIANRFNRRVTQ